MGSFFEKSILYVLYINKKIKIKFEISEKPEKVFRCSCGINKIDVIIKTLNILFSRQLIILVNTVNNRIPIKGIVYKNKIPIIKKKK